MKIIDLRCAMIGNHPVIRIVTDAGIDGFSQVESWKPFLIPNILDLKDLLVGQDPTDVENCMIRIRHRGGFKPWGAAVSAVEIALWDIAGKALSAPIYKLLGGKLRDRVRVYNGARRKPLTGYGPEDYAQSCREMLECEEGFTLVKQPISFHSNMHRTVPEFYYGSPQKNWSQGMHDTGRMTEKGLAHVVECVAAMKEVLRDDVGLALDCGPGWTVPDAIRFAQAVEQFNLVWLEDLLTGDYSQFVDATAYRDVTTATSTPIHTGEQIYLRQNFRPLIEQRAVDVIGPDPCDVGGIAELKWIAEYADLYGVQMAPHGTANGLLGLAALVQVSATLPRNFIAFEYPVGEPDWWYDIVEGLPNPIVRDGQIEVLDAPGLGVQLIPAKALTYMASKDDGFFE